MNENPQKNFNSMISASAGSTCASSSSASPTWSRSLGLDNQLPCSVASAVRYVRAYLDHWYLDGQLVATEQLRQAGSPDFPAARQRLADELQALLDADGAAFLDGGPDGRDANLMPPPQQAV